MFSNFLNMRKTITPFRRLRKEVRVELYKISEAVNQILEVYKKCDSVDIDDFDEESLCEFRKNLDILTIHIIRTDNYVEEIFSRIFLHREHKLPGNYSYLDSIENMDIDRQLKIDIKEFRKFRNDVCHSYNFIETLEYVTTEKIKYLLTIKAKTKIIINKALKILKDAYPMPGNEADELYIQMLKNEGQKFVAKTVAKRDLFKKAEMENNSDEVILNIDSLFNQLQKIFTSVDTRGPEKANYIIEEISKCTTKYFEDELSPEETLAEIKSRVESFDTIPMFLINFMIMIAKMCAKQNKTIPLKDVLISMTSLKSVQLLQVQGLEYLSDNEKKEIMQFNEIFGIKQDLDAAPQSTNERRYESQYYKTLKRYLIDKSN